MSDGSDEFLARRNLPDLPLARRRMAARIAGLGVSARVCDAMNAVPRHAFVPAACWRLAYAETGLWLANGAALPAPEATARMLSALEPGAADRVLEIGTGIGYLAALLGRLFASVLTLDRIDLTDGALAAARLDGVRQQIGGDDAQWRAAAPFDAILVSEALPLLPMELLAHARRLVAVVGPPGGPHRLLLARRSAPAGRARVTDLGPLASPMPGIAVAAYGLLPPARWLEGAGLEGGADR